jgi:hypothetical protein
MTNYRFPDKIKDIANLAIQRDLLKNKDINLNRLKDDKDITIGSVFNVKAFNKKLDSIFSDIIKRQKIEEKIAKLKKKSTIPNPDTMTFNQLKSGLILDTYDMFNELFSIKKIDKQNINNVLDKNYRKLTLLSLLLIFFIIFYFSQSIKSYLSSPVRNT